MPSRISFLGVDPRLDRFHALAHGGQMLPEVRIVRLCLEAEYA